MCDQKMLAKTGFMLDDGKGKSTFVIFSKRINGFMVDFVNVSICVARKESDRLNLKLYYRLFKIYHSLFIGALTSFP